MGDDIDRENLCVFDIRLLQFAGVCTVYRIEEDVLEISVYGDELAE